MKILAAYKKYQIMPQLQEHQFRVAAVADFICQNFQDQADRQNIVAACLLHDMGNIVKFTFNQDTAYMTGLAEQEQFDYWQAVKQEFIAKYAADSHTATVKIVEELGVSSRIAELVDCVGFDQASDNLRSDDFGKKICAYSDMRVMPLGLASLEDRLADLRVRYHNHPEGVQKREDFENALRQIENQIFKHCGIKPSDITAGAIRGRKERLKNFEI
ncbi:MAG: HD domain-containing protein [Patescibacteria group bacterium]|nr:HD domain-containing protein [Patescibacteria group bacterium]